MDAPFTFDQKSLSLLLHASLIGSLLAFITGWVNKKVNGIPGDKKAATLDSVFAATNVLFLCVGMSAVMILVNDQIARAFAIGAAIALVRFRIKFAGKFMGVGLLYGVLTGMACGVNRVEIAWMVTALFAILIGCTLLVRSWLRGIKPEHGQSPDFDSRVRATVPPSGQHRGPFRLRAVDNGRSGDSSNDSGRTETLKP